MTPGVCSGNYTIVRTWTATDECGNVSTASQTITVGDNDAPQIVISPLPSSFDCSDVIPAGNATVSDNCDNAATFTVAESMINGSCANDYQLVRTYTATDACGNSSTATQVINVSDNTAPVMNVPTDVSTNVLMCINGDIDMCQRRCTYKCVPHRN